MYRSALRSTPRAVNALRQTTLTTAGRRFASTKPADKKRSWKGTGLRWGLAFGALYWYTTSPAFADEIAPQHMAAPPVFSDDDLPTVEAVIEQKRREAEARLAKAVAAREEATAAPSPADSEVPPTQDGEVGAVGSPADLEAEADQQGAFNPETGEINWDCPCLGGMAHGPCGEEFKAAFSCFVYSKEEPKGIDCIEKFQHMQDCFRAHPDVYGEELADDEEAPAEGTLDGVLEAGTATVKTLPSEGESAPLATDKATKAKTDKVVKEAKEVLPTSSPDQKTVVQSTSK
ncbi:uncharacterized protein BCR38DRAFT_445400 [Pseudomassariella vexata]|uniref:Mitochondrial intermembrane space import and assembly protein 40 n=1 Tax=Pseudomassariella vexata TaxID=1141098 RepID=A0A1Y2DKK0_9PEZI|nr:uncharacterized protein BCR38DRAFT_445400 [Pseudomassariella vexata]ORY59752.1 hypothetical protein BCR38DRAFT_445400 [Pseudomassariella vexata]